MFKICLWFTSKRWVNIRGFGDEYMTGIREIEAWIERRSARRPPHPRASRFDAWHPSTDRSWIITVPGRLFAERLAPFYSTEGRRLIGGEFGVVFGRTIDKSVREVLGIDRLVNRSESNFEPPRLFRLDGGEGGGRTKKGVRATCLLVKIRNRIHIFDFLLFVG